MKSIQLFVILLLISFILFILFQLEWVESKDGFTTNSISEDVPSCQVGSRGQPPPCFATVQKDEYLENSSEFNKDDFILKTKIVTPVCPRNPYDINKQCSIKNPWNKPNINITQLKEIDEDIMPNNPWYPILHDMNPTKYDTPKDTPKIKEPDDSFPFIQSADEVPPPANNPDSSYPDSSQNYSIPVPTMPPDIDTNEISIPTTQPVPTPETINPLGNPFGNPLGDPPWYSCNTNERQKAPMPIHDDFTKFTQI